MHEESGKNDLILRGAQGELYRIPTAALQGFKVGDEEKEQLEKNLEMDDVSGQQEACVTCYGPGCTSV